MDDVLKAALVRMPERTTWDEEEAELAAKKDGSSESRPLAH
jgi:hypothetical protein